MLGFPPGWSLPRTKVELLNLYFSPWSFIQLSPLQLVSSAQFSRELEAPSLFVFLFYLALIFIQHLISVPAAADFPLPLFLHVCPWKDLSLGIISCLNSPPVFAFAPKSQRNSHRGNWKWRLAVNCFFRNKLIFSELTCKKLCVPAGRTNLGWAASYVEDRLTVSGLLERTSLVPVLLSLLPTASPRWSST